MLIKEKNHVLTDMIRNLEQIEDKQWMQDEYAALIDQIEMANKKFYLHDPDIIRWVNKFMPNAIRGLKLSDAIVLRSITQGNVVGVWARQTLKTSFTKIAAIYEALSNEKEVIILLPNETSMRLYERALQFVGLDEVKKEVKAHTKEFNVERVEFLNGGSITITNLKGLAIGSEQYKNRTAVKRKRKTRLFADDFDSIKSTLQEKALDDIFQVIGYKDGNYTILTTPIIRKKDGVQQLSPFQQFVVRNQKNPEQFRYIHRPTGDEVIQEMKSRGAFAFLTKDNVLAEIEASFNSNEMSILLGE